MITIRDESDLSQWFKQNYKKLGFSEIAKDNGGRFPDFTMTENGKQIRVELETHSSHFKLHKHPENKVDRVVCIIEDEKLNVPTVKIKNVKIDKIKEPECSLKNKLLEFLKEKRLVTTSEIKNFSGISWNTAEKALLELAIDGKVERMKKEGVNLWLTK